MVRTINTIRDLEAATYGFQNNSILKGTGVVGAAGIGVTGHDAAIGINGTASPAMTDLYNVVYGQKVWSMLNQEINPLAILPKRPYTTSGWRILKARPFGGADAKFGLAHEFSDNSTGDALTAGRSGTQVDRPMPDEIGGVRENAGIGGAASDGDLTPVAPEYTKLFMTPKTIAHMFEFSELASEMAKIDDGIGDLRALIREDMGKFHAEVQSKMLVMPLEAYDLDAGLAAGSSANGTVAFTDMERNLTSLMKIVSSSAEVHEMGAQHLVAAADGANSVDTVKLYGNTDRAADTALGSSVGFMDAVVNLGDGYAAAEQRVLTLSIMNNLIQTLRTNGASPKVILTGYDTIQAIADLLQSQERFMDAKHIVPTHNGVKGVAGAEVGFRVATYYDIPLIPAKDMPSTCHLSLSTGLSDMLFLDTDHLWYSVLKPTQYFEDGINHGNPFGIGKLGNQGMYRTIGEVGCSFFKGQGKITNLK